MKAISGSPFALATFALAACSSLSGANGPELVISGPNLFVAEARRQAQKCGYRTIRSTVRPSGEKLAESELIRTDPPTECFGEWIATVPDATFAVAAPSVVY